jgi:hypothetical protein
VRPGRTGKIVFVECADPEDVGGNPSKSNQGQAKLCMRVRTMFSASLPWTRLKGVMERIGSC